MQSQMRSVQETVTLYGKVRVVREKEKTIGVKACYFTSQNLTIH